MYGKELSLWLNKQKCKNQNIDSLDECKSCYACHANKALEIGLKMGFNRPIMAIKLFFDNLRHIIFNMHSRKVETKMPFSGPLSC